MKLIPRDSRHGISIFRLAIALTIAALVPLLAYATAPVWWSQRGVLVQNGTADDYALVNQGQLKNIARAAVTEMDAGLPGGAGNTLHALVDAWASPTAQTNDYAPVNLGQLKNIAKPFYDRLIAAGLAGDYPWSGNPNQPDDFALANIGQVKELFSFDLPNPDSDGNGLPDAWEQEHFGHIGVDPNADPDGDGFTNLQEYQNATDPNDYYNGASPQLVLLAGDGQTVKIDSNAPRAFELLVLKADGTPLPNAPVTFAVTSGDGLLASDATPGAPLFGSMTVRADYSGRVRPPVATVLYHASSSPGLAVVQASAQSAVAQFSVTVTIDGPLAAPTLLSAIQNPEDGSTLFEWSLPPSGIPATSSIALLGRGADGVWHTIASLTSSTTSYSAAENEIALFTQFALRVFPAGNGNPSPLSNILNGPSGGGSSGGGSSGLPAYVVVELGNGRRPLAVASDGTVVLYDGLFYRKRGQVEEVLDASFGFQDMNDLGDIVGAKTENGAYSAYAILASNPVSVLTRWAGAGHGGNSYLATSLRQINEKRRVIGSEYMSEALGRPSLRFVSGTTFTSTVPLSLNTIASWSYTYDEWSEDSTGETGSDYNFRDLDNHGRGVGRETDIATNTETSLYYGFGSGPRPPGGNAFDPIALNDDGLVLGFSNSVARLWEPLTGFRTLALPNPLDQDSHLRVSDPPESDPDKTVIILAGNNIVYRTWKDADGQPSAFPIYTTRAAADLLPPDSPFTDLTLQNISNNGIIVATARQTGDNFDRAIMLVPVELTWEAQQGFDNVEDNKKITAVDVNDSPTTRVWMQGKGSRIFPDKKNPTDTTPNRNRCVLHIKSAPNLTVHLKTFDVDDATPDSVDDDAANKIDPNNQAGDDNMDTVWARSGKFISSGGPTATVTLDANGEAKVIFETTNQPGDNFRVALAFKAEDINSLQVHSPSGSGFISGDSGQQPGGFNGIISPMLTVWRRLWCEFDSMGPPPLSGAEKNFDEGTIQQVSESSIQLNSFLTDEGNRFQNGRIYIDAIGDFAVLDNTDFSFGSGDIVTVTGTPGVASDGRPFSIRDDDYFGVKYLGGPERAPRSLPYQISGGTLIYTAFSDAFIEPQKVPAVYTQDVVSFKRNVLFEDLGIAIANKGLVDTEDFWVVQLVGAWQPEKLMDLDPGEGLEEAVFGFASAPQNAGFVFVETIREREFFLLNARVKEECVIVHEIGHMGKSPTDHSDGGIMREGAPTDDDPSFRPVTLKRFRESKTF